jgi:naphtho-gamma-pyrone polyketide synthase
MGQSTQIFVFGDQTHSFESGLRWLFQRKDNVLLLSFFERTHYALRLEISKLGVHERDLFPRFTSLVDLLANYRKSTNNPALESAFTTIHQIGCFIRQDLRIN